MAQTCIFFDVQCGDSGSCSMVSSSRCDLDTAAATSASARGTVSSLNPTQWSSTQSLDATTIMRTLKQSHPTASAVTQTPYRNLSSSDYQSSSTKNASFSPSITHNGSGLASTMEITINTSSYTTGNRHDKVRNGVSRASVIVGATIFALIALGLTTWLMLRKWRAFSASMGVTPFLGGLTGHTDTGPPPRIPRIVKRYRPDSISPLGNTGRDVKRRPANERNIIFVGQPTPPEASYWPESEPNTAPPPYAIIR